MQVAGILAVAAWAAEWSSAAFAMSRCAVVFWRQVFPHPADVLLVVLVPGLS